MLDGYETDWLHWSFDRGDPTGHVTSKGGSTHLDKFATEDLLGMVTDGS